MPTYLVTYKFGMNDDYLDRHDRFMAHLTGGDWWGETGSTILAHNEEPIDEFCFRVFSPDCFDEAQDVAVVFDLESREGRARGRFLDYGLFTVAPWIERL
jgi:hypothetical protein